MCVLYLDEITGVQYKEIIKYLYKKCDVAVFCLPNYGTVFYTDSFETIYVDYERAKPLLDRETEEFLKYKKTVTPLLKELQESIISVHTHFKYYNQGSNYEREIYELNFDEKTYEVLLRYDSFCNWRYPNAPEDWHFLSNGKLMLEIVSHEEEGYINSPDPSFIAFLESLGIELG